jgi:hypothetical protein
VIDRPAMLGLASSGTFRISKESSSLIPAIVATPSSLRYCEIGIAWVQAEHGSKRKARRHVTSRLLLYAPHPHSGPPPTCTYVPARSRPVMPLLESLNLYICSRYRPSLSLSFLHLSRCPNQRCNTSISANPA